MRKFLAGIGVLTLTVAAFGAVVKSRGNANARVTLEVYSDYQCPGCKALYLNTLVPLIQTYVDTGKVLLVHRDFPLPIHAHSMEAASYACAANRVGKYEQVSDVLFRKQDSWAATGKVDETACSVLSPEEAKKVRALAKDQSVMAEVLADIQAGRMVGVDGTPTLFVKHADKVYRIPNGASYEILRRFIDQLLVN